jgi:peptidase E
VIYGGDSAGAIIAGPTLKYYDSADDPKLAQEAMYDALNLVDVAILPHWGSGEYGHVLGTIEEKLKADGYKTRRLTDNEYLLVENGKVFNI